MARRGVSQTYGFPIYCAAWLPLADIIASAAAATSPDSSTAVACEGPEADASALPESAAAAAGDEIAAESVASPPRLLAALGGGGGEGRSGVPNALAVAALDSAAGSLSDQPVFRMGTEEQVPYRMAVHPRGDGVICAFPNGCRRFHWELPEGRESHNLALRPSDEILTQLEDVGLLLAISFSAEGSILATGGEDGHLRIFKWPAMETILEEPDTKTSVKDLSFSSDEKFLASIRNSGPCRVWDLKSSEVIANLPREAGEIFGFCRFSHKADNRHILFVTAMQGDYGKIISWNTTSWTRIGSKKITREAISAFSVSPDGTLLAIGTIEGSIIILGSGDMRVLMTVRKAHLGIITALVFSHDSRALLSTSFDSTARVTLIESPKSNGISLWPMLLVIILAILVYYYMQHKEALLALLSH